MKRLPVWSRDENGLPRKSEIILSGGYSIADRILEIEFRSNGAVYQYLNVPPIEWSRFMAAASKGNFVQTILATRYKFRRVK